MKDSDLEFAFDLNVKAMIRTIRAVLPGMIERKDGAIINMASVASSIKGVPNRFAYGVTKAAVIGLTKAVAADYVGQGIRCNAICPGTVESPSLQDRMRAQGDYDAARAAFIARQPMGLARLAGRDRRSRRLSRRRDLHVGPGDRHRRRLDDLISADAAGPAVLPVSPATAIDSI